MKWAFIDYENIHSLEKVGDLSAYMRIIVFLGAKQQSINFGELRSHKMLNLSVIQIEAVADNNLDFHLTYYLGLFDKQEDDAIEFDVISNDKGFDGVIAHINKL